jgi:hypothetical protein
MDRAGVISPEASRAKIRTELMPLTSTPTPPTREGAEGGMNVAKSPRIAVKLIEQAESTTLNCERSRPGVREDEKATKLKGALTSVSSYSCLQSSRVDNCQCRRR